MSTDTSTVLTPITWTRAQYDRLALSGVLEGTYAELIDGQIVEVDVTRSPAHDNTIHRVTRALTLRVGIDRVRVQRALALSDRDEPEPDVMVIDERPIPFDEHPTTALLVVEVAVSSQAVDLGAKRDVYARAGLPAYWVVDPLNRLVHTFRDPVEGRYTSAAVVSHGARLEPFTVASDEVLPPEGC